MPIEFACESCRRLLRVPDGSAGLLCECPACRSQLTVPDPEAIHIVETADGTLAADGNSGNDRRIRIPCPKCQHVLVCSPDLLGTKGQCRNCQYIFLISNRQESQLAATSEWLFNCPKCNQLFEGKPEMRGRKGKCHSCGEVFSIELRAAPVGDDVAIKPVSSSAAPKNPSPRNLSVSPQVPRSPAAEAAPMPRKPAAPAGPIQLACTSCRGVMEVPGNSAGQTTACPFCQTLLQIPEPGSLPPSPAPQRPAQHSLAPQTPTSQPMPNPFADLGSAGTGFGGMPVQPYQSPQTFPNPSSQMRSGRSPATYMIPGITIAVMAGIEIVLVIVFAVLNLYREDPANAPPGYEAGLLLGSLVVTGAIVALLIVQIVGGIAVARQRNLAWARAGSIIACLPCIYCLLLSIPFGIWSTVLTFSADAKRDFR